MTANSRPETRQGPGSDSPAPVYSNSLDATSNTDNDSPTRRPLRLPDDLERRLADLERKVDEITCPMACTGRYCPTACPVVAS